MIEATAAKQLTSQGSTDSVHLDTMWTLRPTKQPRVAAATTKFYNSQ